MLAYFADKKLRNLPNTIEREKRLVKQESRAAEREVTRLQAQISVKTRLAEDAAGGDNPDEFARLCEEATEKKIELQQALQQRKDYSCTLQHLNQAHGHARLQRSRRMVCRSVERINSAMNQSSKAGSINRYDEAIDNLREMQENNENISSESNHKANEMKEQMQREMMRTILNKSNLPTANVHAIPQTSMAEAGPAFAGPEAG